MEELERGRSSKGFRWFFCCGGTNFGPREPGQHKPKAPRRHARGSGGARRGARRPSSPSKASLRGDPCHVSILSEDESWHDVQDAFSVGDDGSHSPLPSIPGSPRGSTSLEGRGDEPGGGGGGGGGASAGPGSLLQRSLGGSTSRGGGGGGSVDGEELSCSSEAAPEAASGSGVGGGGLGARLVGSCLSGLRQGEAVTGEVAVVVSPKSAAALGGPRPPIGCTMRRRRPDEDPAGCERCWDVSDPTSFHIRSLDYMRTKVKEHSGGAIYRLAAVDVFTTEAKAFHVARLFSLPAARGPVLAGDAALPPILIFNILLPAYTGGFFGPTDGPGQCLVYTFVLPDDFDAATFPNKPALGLLGRFVSNGREADGGSTRDRLKLIARVSNPEEWAARAPLSGAELKLLTTYNEKPLLTRPQQHFFTGPNYLEVDVDVHAYAFLARRALTAYHSRLRSVVFENAFVVQGNSPDELPEYVLGATCVYRTDFENALPLADYAAAAAATAAAAQPAPAAPPPADAGAAEAAPGAGGGGGATQAAAAGGEG